MNLPSLAVNLRVRLTPYGMLVRALRIVAKTTLFNMAQHLSCTSAMLSSVEFGRRPLTQAMVAETAAFFSSLGIHDTLPALKAAFDAGVGELVEGDAHESDEGSIATDVAIAPSALVAHDADDLPGADLHISIQEAWEAAGGNPGVTATRDQLVAALKMLDGANEDADLLGDCARVAAALIDAGRVDEARASLSRAIDTMFSGAGTAYSVSGAEADPISSPEIKKHHTEGEA